MLSILLFSLTASAFDPPTDAVLVSKAVAELKNADHRAIFPGFTTSFSTPNCYAMNASTLVGLSVDTAGRQTLYVTVNIVSSRGGFAYYSFIDTGADGVLDGIETLPAEPSDYAGYSQMFHDALLCYTRQ